MYGNKYGNLQTIGLSIQDIVIKLISSILVIIAFCTILFIVLFVMQAAISPIANQLPYEKAVDENGKIVVTDKPNLLYNDFKVKTARILYLANPEGQAMEIYDNTLEEPIFIYQLPIYSCGLIVIINVLGITLFNRKELK